MTCTVGLQWRLPSQLIITSEPLVRDVVSSTMLRRHLNYDYLHRSVASALNHKLVTSLGVQTLNTQHLLEIGKTIVAQLQPADGNCLTHCVSLSEIDCLINELQFRNPGISRIIRRFTVCA